MKNIIHQDAYHRQRMMKYLANHTVAETSIQYRVSKKTVYKWKKRYDGSLESLKNKNRKPHRSPRSQSPDEIRLVKNAWLKDKEGDKLVMWYNACQKGYTRCYQTFLRTIRKFFNAITKKRKRRKPKPYQRAEYPGQKIQIDVKYVPTSCIADGNKYYQFTAIDECTRLPYRELYEEHSTYSSKDFLYKVLSRFPFPVREVQTDNGTEFTDALLSIKKSEKTLFEQALSEMEILYHRIRIATPRHNGKVERCHRNDQRRFYRKLRMYNLEDGRRQLKAYQKKSEHYPITSLKYQSPIQVLDKYLGVM